MSNENRRKHITAPYQTFSGEVLNEAQCKGYNDIQDDINRWIDAGKPVPDHLLEWSHRYLQQCIDVSRGDPDGLTVDEAEHIAANPDGCDVDDLRKLARFLGNSRNTFPSWVCRPFHESQAARNRLLWYCRLSIQAREYRVKGNIQAALNTEAEADKRYRDMPEWAKW